MRRRKRERVRRLRIPECRPCRLAGRRGVTATWVVLARRRRDLRRWTVWAQCWRHDLGPSLATPPPGR